MIHKSFWGRWCMFGWSCSGVAKTVLLLVMIAFFAEEAYSREWSDEEVGFQTTATDKDRKSMRDKMNRAEKGDVMSCYYVGYNYAEGKGGVVQDLDKAADWYKKGISLGGKDARFCYGGLGDIYRNYGQVFKAIENYEKGAAMDGSSSAYALGLIYERNTYGLKDTDKAANWFKRSMDIKFSQNPSTFEDRTKLERQHLATLGVSYTPKGATKAETSKAKSENIAKPTPQQNSKEEGEEPHIDPAMALALFLCALVDDGSDDELSPKEKHAAKFDNVDLSVPDLFNKMFGFIPTSPVTLTEVEKRLKEKGISYRKDGESIMMNYIPFRCLDEDIDVMMYSDKSVRYEYSLGFVNPYKKCLQIAEKIENKCRELGYNLIPFEMEGFKRFHLIRKSEKVAIFLGIGDDEDICAYQITVFIEKK